MVDLVPNHLELSRRTAPQLIELATAEYAGARYSHDKPHEGRYSRWRVNPVSIPLSSLKGPTDVLRKCEAVKPLTFASPGYAKLHELAKQQQHVVRGFFAVYGH